MSAYHDFIVTRTTEPDPMTLLANLRVLDPTAGVNHSIGTNVYTLKKATAWTGPQITAAQNAIEAAPVSTPQLTARAIIATWPIERRAEWLVLIDEINILRLEVQAIKNGAPLSGVLTARTPAQAIAALNAKIDQLT